MTPEQNSRQEKFLRFCKRNGYKRAVLLFEEEKEFGYITSDIKALTDLY